MDNHGKQSVSVADMLYEEIDTEMKYAIDQQYRNDPETRREIVDSMGDDHMDGYYVGGYKKLFKR